MLTKPPPPPPPSRIIFTKKTQIGGGVTSILSPHMLLTLTNIAESNVPSNRVSCICTG